MVPAHPVSGSGAETAPSGFLWNGCILWVWLWCGVPPEGGPYYMAAISLIAVVAGEREGFPRSVTLVYRRLCRGLQAGLARLGIEVLPGTPRCLNNDSFNCFAGVAGGDLSWQGKKFVGSAQVWQGRTFLQHGAILLNSQEETWRLLLGASDRDSSIPMISLTEILGAPPSLSDLKDCLIARLSGGTGPVFRVRRPHFLGRSIAWPSSLRTPALSGKKCNMNKNKKSCPWSTGALACASQRTACRPFIF